VPGTGPLQPCAGLDSQFIIRFGQGHKCKAAESGVLSQHETLPVLRAVLPLGAFGCLKLRGVSFRWVSSLGEITAALTCCGVVTHR
jgi:hypothetical protein